MFVSCSLQAFVSSSLQVFVSCSLQVFFEVSIYVVVAFDWYWQQRHPLSSLLSLVIHIINPSLTLIQEPNCSFYCNNMPWGGYVRSFQCDIYIYILHKVTDRRRCRRRHLRRTFSAGSAQSPITTTTTTAAAATTIIIMI